MAYSFGGGVRPELGRTDFTPFLQGSAQGAQMQARGAENFAAGVSQFLQKAGEGVKAYQENKAINTMFNSTIDDAIKLNEEGGGELARVLKIADPSDRGAWAAGIKSLGEGDKRKGSMAVRTFMMEMAQKEKQRAEIAAALAPRPSAAQDAIMGGASFENIPTGAGAFMQRQPNAQELFTSLAPIAGVGPASAAANTALNIEQSQNPPQPKLNQFEQIVQDEINAFKAETRRDPTPQELAAINQRVLQMGRSPTIINTGNVGKMREMAFDTFNTQYNSEIAPLLSTAPSLEAMEILINNLDEKGKIITGGLARLELGAKSILNDVGITDFEDVARTQEYIGLSVNLVGQIIKQFGAGTGLSDADREFATKAAAGDIKMDRAALQRLVSMAKKVSRLKINSYNERVKRTFSGDDQESKFALNSLLVSPSNKDAEPSKNKSIYEEADAILGNK